MSEKEKARERARRRAVTRRAVVDPTRKDPEGFHLQRRNPQLRAVARPKIAGEWLKD